MNVLPDHGSREEYRARQIARSESKFRFCKVSSSDVAKYRTIILHSLRLRGKPHEGPILCLGTRNGREVDLFRLHFFGPRVLRLASRVFERRTHSFVSLLPPLEAVGRSEVEHLSRRSVVGVEINRRAERKDIWIDSFDQMPARWERTFGILFSNSFDQSQDPHKTAREWKRVARSGAYLIFCFAKDAPPTPTDPVGDLRLEDILDLFGGELIYFRDGGSRNGYSEVILRFPDA